MHPLCCFSKSRMNKKKLDRDKLFYDTIKCSLWELLKLNICKKIKKCGTILYKLEMAHMHESTLIIFYKLFYTINIFIIKNFNFLQDEYETF